MNILKIFAVVTVLYGTLGSSSLTSSICKPGEDQFAVYDIANNKVYIDGKETNASFTIATINMFYNVIAFCVPPTARLVAVTNVLSQFEGMFLIGSVGDKLVTNEKWRCVEETLDGDWYQVWYDDSKWPQAYTKLKVFPNISQNALSISASPVPSKKYYCRGWIGGRPVADKLLTRSAFAAKTGKNQRLDFHLIQSFQVYDVFECVIRCQDYGDCVSMNFERNLENGRHDALKICELNREAKTKVPQYVMLDKKYDYYDIIRRP